MLNKPYKFKREDFDQILFTSDQHYNHNPNWSYDPLWKTRGFKSIDEHDEWMRSEYAKVSEKSIIFSLGDPALNSTPEKLLGLFNQTNAHIYHIWGNHFSCDYAIYRSAMNLYIWLTEYYDYPASPCGALDVTLPLKYEMYPFTVTRYFDDNVLKYNTKYPDKKLIHGQPGMVLSPPTLTFLGSDASIQIDKKLIYLKHMASLIWDHVSSGAYCATGHSHGNCKQLNIDTGEGRILDIGVDNSIKYNNSAFFSFEDFIRILEKRKPMIYDHH
jgi:hypothetical protein